MGTDKSLEYEVKSEYLMDPFSVWWYHNRLTEEDKLIVLDEKEQRRISLDKTYLEKRLKEMFLDEKMQVCFELDIKIIRHAFRGDKRRAENTERELNDFRKKYILIDCNK